MVLLIGLVTSILIFLIITLFFSKPENNSHKKSKSPGHAAMAANTFTISSKDIETIAGDDIMLTQLDLARAYIETGRKNLARNILNNVVQNGSSELQREARSLLENHFS
jgi:FimV-like protein